MGKKGKKKTSGYFEKHARYERYLQICNDDTKPRRARTRAARWATAVAEQLGMIARPACCEWCRRTAELERHHWDYKNPLAVTFFCADCHVVADAFQQAHEEESGNRVA